MLRSAAEPAAKERDMVTLVEDIFLLASDEATGRTRIPTAYLDLGLGGALLLDLVLRARLALVDEHVAVVAGVPTGDSLLDTALSAVAASAKRHEPEYWVRHLARGTRSAVQRRLVAAGVLLVDDHKVLGVVALHHTHQVDDRIEHELVRRLREVVVVGLPASRETAALVSLTLAVGLEQHLFPRSDRHAIQHRMRQISGGEWVGAAVTHAVAAVNAALGITPDPAAALETET
jgi:hypothetical protein